jgi:hypothetical protein
MSGPLRCSRADREGQRAFVRLAASVIAVSAVLASACGSSQPPDEVSNADVPAPPPESVVVTARPTTSGVVAPVTPETTMPATTAPESTDPGTTVPSTGAEARAALLPFLGADLGRSCPLASDVELVADGQASWRTEPIEVYSDEQSVECVLRSAEGPPALLSVKATIDVESVEAILADDSLFMASSDPYPRSDGDLWVRCPREQTVGDIPEKCLAYWIAYDGQLAIVATMSAPAVTLEEADYFGQRVAPKALTWLTDAPSFRP